MNKGIKKFFKIAGYVFLSFFIIFLVFLSFVTGYPINYYKNNSHLKKLSSELASVDLPSQTTEIGSQLQEFGNLAPAGNSCSFHAGQLVESDLSLEELQSYYNAYSFEPYRQKSNEELYSEGGGNDSIKIRVSKIDSKESLKQNVYRQPFDEWYNDVGQYIDESDYKNIFWLDFIDGPYPPNEIRCH